MSLKRLGWNSYFDALWQVREQLEWLPARVISQQRGLWRIAGDFAECWAEVSGTLRAGAEAGGDWPAVGDWVAAEILSGGGRPLVHKVLPRRSKFVRKVAGRRMEEQVIAANVDTAFVVMALDGDFNVRRLERYLAQCWESGAKSIVILNKADDCEDVPARVAEVESIAAGVPIFAVSARTGAGVDALDIFLAPGQTIVLLGSSGVGKSTLVNHFLRRDAQVVQTVRASDSRGRHTTTSRELFALPGGALLIDTPGLRELQLWEATEGVEQAFSDIERGSAGKPTQAPTRAGISPPQDRSRSAEARKGACQAAAPRSAENVRTAAQRRRQALTPCGGRFFIARFTRLAYKSTRHRNMD